MCAYFFVRNSHHIFSPFCLSVLDMTKLLKELNDVVAVEDENAGT